MYENKENHEYSIASSVFLILSTFSFHIYYAEDDQKVDRDVHGDILKEKCSKNIGRTVVSPVFSCSCY